MFFRSEPEYCVGNLVVYTNNEQKNAYLLIGARHWIRQNGKGDKQWLYEGLIFVIEGEELKPSTYASGISEDSLRSMLLSRKK